MKHILIALLLCSCSSQTKEQEILRSDLFEQDRANKELELEYLHEIKIAEENNDSEAFEFFLRQYLEVPRLDLNESYKKDPRYFIGGMKLEY